MAHITTVEARAQFAEVINRAAYGKERVVLTRRGKPLVAVVPVDDLELLKALEDRLDLADARAALADAEANGTESWEDLRRELSL